MIPQIKSFIVVLLFMFSVLMPSNAQEETLTTGIDFSDSLLVIDSLIEVQAQQLNRKLHFLESRLTHTMEQQQVMIDSLVGISILHDAVISDLERENRELIVQMEMTEQMAVMNKYVINAEKERTRRMFYIAGPALLGLILISTVLFFLLISRQAEQTDRKIMALRKYTYTEVDETRSELLNSFKKRIKKLREKMKEERKEKRDRKATKRKKTKKK
ncbi:MAG: hypothetical protein WD577_03615 [Bacteroidales bacterium]